MALSFFNKQKHNETLTLLVDIGSASVGAALVFLEKGRAPHIVAIARENISFQEVLSSQRFLPAMSHALDKTLKSLQSGVSQQGAVSQVFCTLSSPWFILKNRNIRIERDAEFEVTNQVIDEFINADIELLKEDLRETLPPEDVRIIEKKIIQMRLNGYEIKNPYNQKTSNVELAVTVGISSGKVIDNIEKKLRNFFHVKLVHFGTFPVAAFNVIRDIFPTEKNFIFVDVTGEATDVSLVNNDLLVGTVSFSRGKNYFIREISAELRTVHEEAATLFAMFIREELDSAKHAQVASIILRAEAEWFARFKKAVNTLSGNGALTRKVFFTSDADVASLFSRLVSNTKSELLAGGSFDVQYLDQLIVSQLVSLGAGVTRDPFVIIEALLAEKIFEQHT